LFPPNDNWLEGVTPEVGCSLGTLPEVGGGRKGVEFAVLVIGSGLDAKEKADVKEDGCDVRAGKSWVKSVDPRLSRWSPGCGVVEELDGLLLPVKVDANGRLVISAGSDDLRKLSTGVGSTTTEDVVEAVARENGVEFGSFFDEVVDGLLKESPVAVVTVAGKAEWPKEKLLLGVDSVQVLDVPEDALGVDVDVDVVGVDPRWPSEVDAEVSVLWIPVVVFATVVIEGSKEKDVKGCELDGVLLEAEGTNEEAEMVVKGIDTASGVDDDTEEDASGAMGEVVKEEVSPNEDTTAGT
jgi:hypothetical protein